MNWKVGDRAIFRSTSTNEFSRQWAHLVHDRVCVLLKYRGEHNRIYTREDLSDKYHSVLKENDALEVHIESAWEIEVQDSGERFIVDERCLHPLYDGNEKMSWEDGVWKPDAIKDSNQRPDKALSGSS